MASRKNLRKIRMNSVLMKEKEKNINKERKKKEEPVEPVHNGLYEKMTMMMIIKIIIT